DHYPLTAPAVRPATIRFWKNSTSKISGIEMMTDAAAIVPSGSSNSVEPVKNAIAAGTVRAFGVEVNVTANRNSFQGEMNGEMHAGPEPGGRERDDDLPERLEPRRPVDERGFLEVLRNLLEERHEDVDRQREGER